LSTAATFSSHGPRVKTKGPESSGKVSTQRSMFEREVKKKPSHERWSCFVQTRLSAKAFEIPHRILLWCFLRHLRSCPHSRVAGCRARVLLSIVSEDRAPSGDPEKPPI